MVAVFHGVIMVDVDIGERERSEGREPLPEVAKINPAAKSQRHQRREIAERRRVEREHAPSGGEDQDYKGERHGGRLVGNGRV